MARESEWMLLLADGVQKRHWHRTQRGKVVAFAVQLEIWLDNAWQPIVRYDAAHGFPHRDVYETTPRKRKDELDVGMNEALTAADRDINTNWPRYVREFRGRIRS